MDKLRRGSVQANNSNDGRSALTSAGLSRAALGESRGRDLGASGCNSILQL